MHAWYYSDMLTVGQNRQAKLAFLERYAVLGNISVAAKETGIARSTVYVWREIDPDFEAAFRDAERDALEYLEHVAWKRATEGVSKVHRSYYRGEIADETVETKYSDTLLIFLLKGLAPEKYRERYDARISGGLELKDLGALLQAREERTIESTRVPAQLPEPSDTIENEATESPFYGESGQTDEANDA